MSECVMLQKCQAATGINCKGRNYRECHFFIHLLSVYCRERIRENCQRCKYAADCTQPKKRIGKSAAKSKPKKVRQK